MIKSKTPKKPTKKSATKKPSRAATKKRTVTKPLGRPV